MALIRGRGSGRRWRMRRSTTPARLSRQALHLHRSARTLHRELKAAEAALATEPTDENYRHMLEIQAQFRDAQATEALIEGFGIPSGRASRVILAQLICFFEANRARARLTFRRNGGIRTIRKG